MMSLYKTIEEQSSLQKGVLSVEKLPISQPELAQINQIIKQKIDVITIRLKNLCLCGADDTLETIVYNSKAIFRDQIRILSPEHAPKKEITNITFIILFFSTTGQIFNISPIARIISSPQWNDATPIEQKYKAFQMDDLFKIDLNLKNMVVEKNNDTSFCATPTTTSMSISSSDPIQNRKVREFMEKLENWTIRTSSEKIKPKKRLSYRVSYSDLSFVDIISSEGTNKNRKYGSLSRYAQLILDHTHSSKFSDINLHDEYLAFINYNPNYSHHRSIIGFIYELIIHTKNKPNGQKIVDKILEKIIDTEVHLNVRSLDPDDVNALVLHQFIYEIQEVRPSWFDHLRLDNIQNGAFWVETNDNHFRVKSDWLFKLSQPAELYYRVVNGHIDLTMDEFTDQFLPVFYRLLIIDLINYIVHIEYHHQHFRHEIFELESMDKFIHQEDPVDFFETFPLDESLSNYYDFSVAFGYPTLVSEKISIKLSTQDYFAEQIKSSSSSSNPTNNNLSSSSMIISFEFDRSTLPDLEDLLDTKKAYLPPCLKNLVNEDADGNNRRKKLKMNDRIAVTSYLTDMKYTGDEIAQAFPVDAKDLKGHSNTFNKRRDKKFNSFYCSNIMDKTKYNPDDHCQCPYSMKDTKKRRYINEDDKKQSQKRYRDECFSTIIPRGSFLHPLNYVTIQMNKQ
jgi:hypothetical protein